MLLSPAMRNAVLQATAICTISLLYSHSAEENMFDEVRQDENVNKLLSILVNGTLPTDPIIDSINNKLRIGEIVIDTKHTVNTSFGNPFTYATLKHGNGTGTNGTANDSTSDSFYGRKLPREVVISFVLAMLQYWWFIGLERILPTRPRYRDVPVQQKDQVEESEDREEEVVKKWIAQGRVHRASLSWRNTFLKWVLDLTIGLLCVFTVEHMLRQTLKLKSPMLIFDDLDGHLIYNFLITYFSVAPIARLVAFIVVPAYKQIVFIEGIQLVWTVFAMQFVGKIASWVVKKEFVQNFMKDMIWEFEYNAPEYHERFFHDREL